MRNIAMVFVLICYRSVQTNCPDFCNQNSCSFGLLLCSDTGLDMIPEIPPPKTTKIVIRNQRFRNSVLAYRNLSKYGPEEINLKLLTIHNCGITEIESESFSHLIHLTEMDLSHNDLRAINPRTFKALNLKSLNLDGNKFLKLTANSFQGLVVSSLSLASCGLHKLQFDSIKEISGHLIRFNLSQNNIRTLSLRFYLLFKRLEEIRLEGNELKCDCRIKWLSQILKAQINLGNSVYSPVTCFLPKDMNGKIISDLEESKFICPKPDLKAIGVDLSTKSAILYCSTHPNSDSQVSWHLKHHQNNTYFKIQDLIETPNNASIKVERKTQADQFSCTVSNENGNISVDLNIRWPDESSNKSRESLTPIIIFSTTNRSSKSKPVNQMHYIFIKQFTFLEMILSIGSTFVVTTIAFALIYLFISRRMNITLGKPSPSKGGYQGGVYSDTQIYDLPQYSSPNKSFQRTAPLIDFKTQKPINPDSL